MGSSPHASKRRGVIVTGGSSGIGLAVARLCALRGFDVGLVARTPNKLEDAARDVRGSRGTSGSIVAAQVAELGDLDSTRAALGAVVDAGVNPDVMVNSAGVIVPGEFLQLSVDDFASNIASGFWSTVNSCRVVAPLMVAHGAGHIINVSSVAGFLGVYGYTGYAAAKFAVMGFTEALRSELKPVGVTVSIVCPPDTETAALARERELRPRETEAIAGAIEPLPAERVAAAVLRCIDRPTYYVIPGLQSRFLFRLKGLLPELVFRFMDRSVRNARE